MRTPRIIQENKDFLIVYKPAGMASETARVTEMDLETWLLNYRRKKGEAAEIHLIERLDQPVDGLLLAAKTKKAAAELSNLQRKGLLEKTYQALVSPYFRSKEAAGLSEEGEMLASEGRLTDFLKKNLRKRMAEIAESSDPAAKKAVLDYKVLKSRSNQRQTTCLVEVRLITGRFHQIRAQFSSRGWPIVGDRRYGGRPARRLCLSSVRLIFPWKGETVSAEIKPDFCEKI
ncbi:MAG: RNA pseudouridine synthase [Lachnospiraceae bacterium]|nr:RNA pseudouridine synthase [Lachnospiraceae bacterium]